MNPTLRPQEIPLNHQDSKCMFCPGSEKPFVATPAALKLYQMVTILQCLDVLQQKAREHNGLDYLQVFENATKTEALWFIEDDAGGAITALLPSDY